MLLTGNAAYHGWHFELLQQLREGRRLHSEKLASMGTEELHAAVRRSLRQEESGASNSSKLQTRSKL